jgi:lipoate-protein ligase A
VCRRPTGGRGVLHHDEVTYSAVASVADGLPRGVAASYRMLCGALVDAYRALGVPADLTGRPRGDAGSGACYLHATHADLSLGAAKLSGSAQVWHNDTCLQHGSFVLTRDLDLEAAAFGLDADGRNALAESTRTIVDEVGVRPSSEAVAAAVVSGFEAALGISLAEGVLSDAEQAEAERSLDEYRVDTLA